METPLVQETSSGAVPLYLDTLGFPQANDKFSLYAAKFPCRAFLFGQSLLYEHHPIRLFRDQVYIIHPGRVQVCSALKAARS